MGIPISQAWIYSIRLTRTNTIATPGIQAGIAVKTQDLNRMCRIESGLRDRFVALV